MARPRKEIDPMKVRQLAALGLSGEEIAAVLGCERTTLYRRFATAIKEGHERRNASLRRTQFDVAVNQKNPTMLIWLGKQFLGQSDKAKNEHSGPGGGPIETAITVEFVKPSNNAS